MSREFINSALPIDRPQAQHPAHRARPAATAAAVRGELPVELDFRHAGRRRVCLRYETQGDAGLPAVFVAGGISAGRHVAASAAFPEEGWWDRQAAPGWALDPRRHRLVSFDWVGADGTLDVPIDPADQADAIAGLLDALGIARLTAFVGCSYGAMVGLQFGARHAPRLQQLVAISGSHRADPHACACRALQRRAVALGALQCDERHGVDLARQLAMLSYRTPEEFALRFGDAPRVVNGRVRVAAEDYLDHCGASYADVTSPVAFLRLSESIDLQALDPRQVRVPVTVVGNQHDRLVPLADLQELVERLGTEPGLPAPRLCVLRSIHGHDAFLKEHEAIGEVLAEVVSEPSNADDARRAAAVAA
ncbi:MAG: homoserine O-succinyltransferase [Pseudomonadota bacterium]|nr:homoserine O-succinyltransferase [Pseudomonadota bacterium]